MLLKLYSTASSKGSRVKNQTVRKQQFLENEDLNVAFASSTANCLQLCNLVFSMACAVMNFIILIIFHLRYLWQD